MISDRTEFSLEAGAVTRGALLAQAGSKTGALSAVAAVGGIAGVPGAEQAATLLSAATMKDAAQGILEAPAETPGITSKLAAMGAEGFHVFLAGLKLNLAAVVATRAAGLAYDIAHPPSNVQHVHTTKLKDEHVLPYHVSDAAYTAPHERSDVLKNTNYRLDKELSTEETAIYHDPVAKHTVAGFRGTVPTILDDYKADKEIFTTSEREHRRYGEAHEVVKKAKAKYGGTISLTGHSLGGAIAYETAVRMADDPSLTKVTTFNMGASPIVAPNAQKEAKVQPIEHKLNHVTMNNKYGVGDVISVARPRQGNLTVYHGAELFAAHNMASFQADELTQAHADIHHQPRAQQPAQQPAQRQTRHPALQMAMQAAVHVARHGQPTQEQIVHALSVNVHETIRSILPEPAADLLYHFGVHHAIEHHKHHGHHHGHHHHKHGHHHHGHHHHKRHHKRSHARHK